MMRTENAVGKHVSDGVLALVFAVLSFVQAFPVHADTLSGNVPVFTYTGDALPSADDGWDKTYASFEATGASIENGVLHIRDFYTYNGSAISYVKEWQEFPGYINVAEFDVKVVSDSSYVGIYIGSSDGKNNMLYTLYPNRIESSYGTDGVNGAKTSITSQGVVAYFNTTTQFNTYKTVIQNGIAKLYINGNLVMEQMAGPGIYDVHGVQFGSGSSPAIGEAYFDEVRAYRQPVNTAIHLQIAPHTLNLRSSGKWVTAYLELPAQFDANEINLSTVRLQDSIPAKIGKTEIADFNDDGIADIMLKFDRSALQGLLGEGNRADIVIKGEFKDGTPFTGHDRIKIVR